MDTLDHIILATANLEDGCAWFEERTGVTPKFGGKHTDGQTQNAIAALGPRCYLEILAPQPGADLSDPWTGYCARSVVPRLMTWCLSPKSPLSALSVAAQRAGLGETDTYPGGRVTPEGQELEWTLLAPSDGALGFALPFFIHWGGAHHPADTAPGGADFKAFSVLHPKGELLNRYLIALGQEAIASPADAPRFTLTLETPKGVVTL
ncbi:MAG: VOC family protein [Sphingomonadales bacterium]